jgi:ribosome assembly protein YihI (activator of Der GTPase)
MAEVIKIPIELTHFEFPEGVKDRLNSLLDRQDAGERLSKSERQEADGLVELAEFLSLIRLRAQHTTQ